MLEQILLGISSGIVFGIIGYLKSLKKDGKLERFDYNKFTQSVIIGGIIGAVSKSMGINLEVAQQFVFNTGLITIVENLKKWVWRQYIKNLFRKFRCNK